jgi:hypothetical protein
MMLAVLAEDCILDCKMLFGRCKKMRRETEGRGYNLPIAIILPQVASWRNQSIAGIDVERQSLNETAKFLGCIIDVGSPIQKDN